MATARVCDVFGTARAVKTCRITIFELGDDSQEIDDGLYTVSGDLCPRAIERAKNKMAQCFQAPRKRDRP